MRIHVGCELTFEFPQPTPLIAILNVHHSRFDDLLGAETFNTTPAVNAIGYHDQFGNWCNRIFAPAGEFMLKTNAVVNDSGRPDPVVPDAVQHMVQDLPHSTLVYLMGSRYCETDLLSDTAWRLFEQSPPGWQRVQAVCDYVHRHIQFGYEYSKSDSHGPWRVYRRPWGMSGFHTSRRRLLPLSEYSDTLLHRIHYGYRSAAPSFGDGFLCLDGSVPGREMVRLRSPQQRTAHRAYQSRSRPGCRRCPTDKHIRPEYSDQVQGVG